jgi:bacteriorhodopsin
VSLERRASAEKRGKSMMVMLILPVFVIIALVATLPIWPHSKKWGFYPIGGISVIILILLFLYWTGRL